MGAPSPRTYTGQYARMPEKAFNVLADNTNHAKQILRRKLKRLGYDAPWSEISVRVEIPRKTGPKKA